MTRTAFIGLLSTALLVLSAALSVGCERVNTEADDYDPRTA